MDQEFNMSIPVFSPTSERRKVVDFSIPIHVENVVLLTHFPQPTNFSLWSIFGFNLQSWALIVGTFFLIGLLSTIFDWFNYEKPRRVFTNSTQNISMLLRKYGIQCMRQAINAGSLFMDQGIPSQNISAALCILFGIWSLCCVVLAGVYASHILVAALASDLTLPYKDLTTFASCIKKKECTIVTPSLSMSTFEHIYTAKSGPFFKLKVALESNRPIEEEDTDKLINWMVGNESRYHVFFSDRGEYASLLQKYPACMLDAVYDSDMDFFCIPFAKGSQLQHLINYAIVALKEAGMIDYISAKYIGNYMNAEETFCRKKKVASKPMDIKVFVGPFLLVGIGAVFGTIVLMWEFFWQKWCLKWKQFS